MAAHGLDGGVDVHRRGEARPHADDHGGHASRGAEVLFCEDRVDEDVGRELRGHSGLRVDDDGDVAGGHGRAHGSRVGAEHATDVLDGGLAQADGLAEADGAADGRGHGQVRHDDLHAAAVQAQRDAGGDVPRAANVNQHGCLLGCRTIFS